jgi:PadR family transcriptional regulator, regulatory protein AphA
MVRIGPFITYATLAGVSSTTVTPRLTETSYIVLGLLEQGEPATPYDLKQIAQVSTNNFWTVPHTQLYTECARLSAEGLLHERQEETGRRRRIYRLTKLGRELLEQWRNEPASAHYEMRDAATLKLFFGGDPAKLAVTQLAAHKRRLAEYEALHKAVDVLPEGQRLALECGLGHEREFVRFWSRIAKSER